MAKRLQALGDWPIPRAEIARLVERIAAEGAAAIALDIFLDGPDRRSSRMLADEVSRLAGGEKYAAAIRELPDSDAAFCRNIGANPHRDRSTCGAFVGRCGGSNLIRVDGALVLDEVTRVGGFAPPMACLPTRRLRWAFNPCSARTTHAYVRVPLLLTDAGMLAAGTGIGDRARRHRRRDHCDFTKHRKALFW